MSDTTPIPTMVKARYVCNECGASEEIEIEDRADGQAVVLWLYKVTRVLSLRHNTRSLFCEAESIMVEVSDRSLMPKPYLDDKNLYNMEIKYGR